MEIQNTSKEDIESKIIQISRGETDLDQERKDKLVKDYINIKEVLKKYIDMKEEYYSLIAIWIVGTYFHKDFESYPYLFLNAMRGSGKTRTLKLITKLSKDGTMMASPTEAVLFRTTGTLGIDEFESVASKDKSSVRELLNASYKKGIKIMRLKRKKTMQGDEQVVEEFEPYRPIVLSNIWGMEEVLADRCITLILEKSNHPVITRLIEDFNECENIKSLVKTLDQCSLCSVVTSENIYNKWNNYIIEKHTYTHNTHNTQHTHTTQSTRKTLEALKIDSIFHKIEKTGIYGRHLELFLPLFFVASMFGDEVLNEMLEISKGIIGEKAQEEEAESRDIMVLDFVSKLEEGLIFHSVKQLANDFKKFIDYEAEDNDNWCNSKWFGRSLKRLSLVLDKRRLARGNDVMLNTVKAAEKLKMFRGVSKNEKV